MPVTPLGYLLRRLGITLPASVSMRMRVTLAFVFSMGSVLILSSVGMMYLSQRAAQLETAQLLRTTTDQIQVDLDAGEYEMETRQGWRDLLKERQRELNAGKLALVLLDKKQRALVAFPASLKNWPRQMRDWQVLTLPLTRPTPPGGKLSTKPLEWPSDPAVLVVATPWRAKAARLRTEELALSFLTLLVCLVAGLGAWAQVGRTLAPIRLLSRQAAAAAADTLELQLSPPSLDAEVTELVETLNGMLTRARDAATGRNRFYASASHELRTPLQALSGHLELALSRPRNADYYRETLAEAHAQTRNLTSLIQSLLALNQLEMATEFTFREQLNLGDLTERILEQLRPISELNQLTFRVYLEDFEVAAPPGHLEMVVRNLLENAVKYAVPRSTVRVKASRSQSEHGGAPVLEIFNVAAPLKDEDLGRYFEAFYRADKARASATGGNGLGLTVCHAVAQANGWEVRLELREDGVQASVTFLPQNATSPERA